MGYQIRYALRQSTQLFLTKLVVVLPGAVAFFVALLISLVAAWLVAVVVRRILASMEFDEYINRWGLPAFADWSPRRSPTLLVARIIALFFVLAGLAIGVAAFDYGLISGLAQALLAYLPNVVGAIFVLFLGAVIARFLSRSVLISAVNMNLAYAQLLSVGVKWLVTVLAVAMALEHLRIAVGIVELAFGILFGGIVLALALAVGLGSKDLVSKSLERSTPRPPTDSVEDPIHHL